VKLSRIVLSLDEFSALQATEHAHTVFNKCDLLCMNVCRHQITRMSHNKTKQNDQHTNLLRTCHIVDAFEKSAVRGDAYRSQ
jgi:hypothetical protein